MNTTNYLTAKFKTIFALIFFILFAGLVSLKYGKDLGWDIANYHFYNPYAFLHGRFGKDFWPASYIHMYFSPTLDFLTYFLITHFTPKIAVVISGMIQGLNGWLLFLISRKFTKNFVCAMFIAVLGLFGPIVFPGLGAFKNDNVLTLFILSFVLLQIQMIEKNDWKIYFLSCLCLGMGVGLKLTAGIYLPGAWAAFMLLPMLKNRLKATLIFILAIVIGMLLVSGYWMVLLWKHYHNPFFPFFNGIFHSPDCPAINFHYTEYRPKAIMQILFYPFYFAWGGTSIDNVFYDLRFPIVYVLMVLAASIAIIKRLHCHPERSKASQHPHTNPEHYLCYFFIICYITWEYTFSVVRYLAPLEMLAPLLIYLLSKRIIRDQYLRNATLFIIFFSMIWIMCSVPIIRKPWYHGDYFNVKVPHDIMQQKKALILLAFSEYALSVEPRPNTYLIPFLPPDWRYIGIPFLKRQVDLSDLHTYKQIQGIIRDFHGQIYALSSDQSLPVMLNALQPLGLKQHGKCEWITSDRQRVSQAKTIICPLVK